MAECIVNFVLTKLADAVVQEVLRFYGVDAKVDAVSRELCRIQVFLKGADKKQIIDEQQKYWVKEVRDVAYSMEDVIDTFLMEVPQQPQESTGLMEKMIRPFKKAKKSTDVRKLLDDEISLIQTKMEEIEKSRLRYGIKNLGEGGGEIQLPIRPLILPDIDPEIIGFNKARDHIVKDLLNKFTKKRYVVSIWGPGGLGKTTLAQKIYNSNDVKERFGVRIWVVISQKFQLIDILRKIMKQLDPNYKQSEDKDEEALLTKINESLRGKTYLIVFDDVWTNDLWIQIEAALPNDNNGSRILMTTRNSDVSKDADPTCEPYKLEYLTNELSFELLLKKAIPNHDPNNSVFHGLSEIMNQFVHKCGGLPLALVVVGGLLSKKSCNYNAWSKVLKTMSWDADGKKCSEIIGTSFEDLPFALKSCFMYFAAFPEDYEFKPNELIQMWIAEGFIQHEDNRTLEETAESFLEDLVQRSMVYVKSRSHDGSIGSCYIHDLLRDLAIQKAKEDKFLVVYSHPDDQRFMSGARRVAVHHVDCDEHMLSQNLRTLLYFGNKYMPNCSKQRLLKVVCTGSSYNTKVKLEMFEELTHLRYLDLTGQPNDKWEGCLEKVIGAMKFLQTLCFHIEDKGLIPIPNSLWHINTLRHVNAYKSCELPPSTKLTNLQTLPELIVTESWETELPHLPNLRSLKLVNNESVSAGSVVAFLGTLEHLITLEIFGKHIPLHIFDMRRFPFYQNLQCLKFFNRCETPHEIAIDVSMFPPHLTYLSIGNYQFHQDVMSVLEKLPCLKVLYLYEVFTNKKLSCSAKGFNQLLQYWFRLNLSLIYSTSRRLNISGYGINNLGEGGGEIQLPIRPRVLPDIDPEMIGSNKDRDHIVKELLNETTKKRYVVSICGPGGLGKTTLAQKVYNSNDVKERFGLRIWVVISQKFQLIDILRKIMKQLDLDPSKQPEDEEAFLTMIYESLRGKTYLIVFDDVWTNDLWIQIEAVLPNDNNGSRILMTTRNSDVSKDADPTCEPYKLEYLTNELSFELLLKKAIPNHDPNNSAFPGLSEIIDQFVHKCGGLPLALVVVGGLLSKKSCNYNAWSKVLKTMSWDADGKKCSEIIGTSFEDLPFALKSCFMYFAAFPEDYEFEPSELIQMWIAEGFIQHEDNRTLEETAESFLEELVQRSMVYVKSRSHDGSIKRCYIHDLLRDLAIQKAKEDKFLVVYSHPDDQRFMSGARRVAIHHLDCDEHMLSQNLRTLLYFGNKYMPNCSKQRLLKVVRTGSSYDTKVKLEMFEGLTQLRYLDLYGQPNDKWEGCLEKVIGAMKFLQTLWFDMKDKGDLIPIPNSLWHINTLRHVNTIYPCRLPPSTKLTNLQTLPKVIVTESWETELPHLPNLRSLKLVNNESVSAGSVVAFLGTLEHLVTLEIEGDHIPLHIFDMRCFPFYQNLQSLAVHNTCETPHEIAIDVSMFPPHLTFLSISNYQFHQDVMSVLEKLPCLKVLSLNKVFTNKKLSCSAKGFNQLESLDLSDMTFEDWEIEDGAMPILRELDIYRCRKLCVPQGLRHLTSLQKLRWVASGGKTDGEIMNLLEDFVPSNVQIDLHYNFIPI